MRNKRGVCEDAQGRKAHGAGIYDSELVHCVLRGLTDTATYVLYRTASVLYVKLTGRTYFLFTTSVQLMLKLSNRVVELLYSGGERGISRIGPSHPERTESS